MERECFIEKVHDFMNKIKITRSNKRKINKQ